MCVENRWYYDVISNSNARFRQNGINISNFFSTSHVHTESEREQSVKNSMIYFSRPLRMKEN